jgi:hypothetical protein
MSNKGKEKERRPVKIFTLDTETRGLFGDIFRVGLFDGHRYHASNTFKEIKNILSKYTIKYDCHVFIHNLDFDLSKMAKDLIPDANLTDSIFINNNVTVFSASINTTQSTEENDIIPQPVVFHDSNKIIMGSLKNICRDFKLDQEQAKIELKQHIINLGWAKNSKGQQIKDESEYHAFQSEGYYFKNVDPWEKELNEYLRMDCVSLYAVVQELIEISELNIHDFLSCPTTASLALRIFKKNYEADYKKATSTKYMGVQGKINEKFVRDSYCGGRTEVFKPYLPNGFHYDVNSLYPFVMKTFRLPYGKPKMLHKDEARKIFLYWLSFGQGAGFLKCDMYIPDNLNIPPLPLKRMKKLIFPVGNVTGIWSFPEIKLALDMGCKIKKVKQCLYFEKTAFLFKNFIEKFELMKVMSEGAKQVFAKLMQNSLYGKFGMKRIRKSLMGFDQLEKCEQRFKEHKLRYVVLENPLVEGQKFIEAETESDKDYIQPHIAAYVTSLARTVLYNGLIMQSEKGEVGYCDTDSIACTAPMEDEIIHNKEYGKWKLESTILEGIFLQPKTYYEKGLVVKKDGSIEQEETRKFKGIPKSKMDNITKETYEAIFNKLIEMQKRIENGETIPKDEHYFDLYDAPEEKRIKFATNLKNPVLDENGEITFDKIFRVTKRLNLLNMQKRQMDYVNNTSKPHKLMEFA